MKSKNNEFDNEFADFHICFTNRTTKQVDHQMMRDRSENKRTVKLQAIPTDDRTRDVALFVGCPVIAKNKCKQNGYVNTDQFMIGAIGKEFKMLQEKDGPLEITTEEFQRNFCVAYCITTHSSQGATIDTPYTIHEFDMMDKKLRYVALSRSTDKNNINVL